MTRVTEGVGVPVSQTLASVVVIGASGFIGSAVAEALDFAGRAVVTPSRREIESGSESFQETLHAAHEVIWLAGMANPRRAQREPQVAVADVELLRSVLAFRERTWPTARLTLISSGGTLYDARNRAPYSESSPIRPAGVYGDTRAALERLLRDDRRKGDCIVRVANAYGPGQRVGTGQGVVGHWVDAAVRGEALRFLAPPGTVRDYVYIGDVASAFVLIAAAAHRPDVVNIGSGKPTSLAEVACVITDLVPGVTTLGPDSDAKDDIAETWLDVRLARDALGWEPLVSLKDGIQLTLHARACAPRKVAK